MNDIKLREKDKYPVELLLIILRSDVDFSCLR